jgi:hypothetical protein
MLSLLLSKEQTRSVGVGFVMMWPGMVWSDVAKKGASAPFRIGIYSQSLALLLKSWQGKD